MLRFSNILRPTGRDAGKSQDATDPALFEYARAQLDNERRFVAEEASRKLNVGRRASDKDPEKKDAEVIEEPLWNLTIQRNGGKTSVFDAQQQAMLKGAWTRLVLTGKGSYSNLLYEVKKVLNEMVVRGKKAEGLLLKERDNAEAKSNEAAQKIIFFDGAIPVVPIKVEQEAERLGRKVPLEQYRVNFETKANDFLRGVAGQPLGQKVEGLARVLENEMVAKSFDGIAPSSLSKETLRDEHAIHSLYSNELAKFFIAKAEVHRILAGASRTFTGTTIVMAPVIPLNQDKTPENKAKPVAHDLALTARVVTRKYLEETTQAGLVADPQKVNLVVRDIAEVLSHKAIAALYNEGYPDLCDYAAQIIAKELVSRHVFREGIDLKDQLDMAAMMGPNGGGAPKSYVEEVAKYFRAHPQPNDYAKVLKALTYLLKSANAKICEEQGVGDSEMSDTQARSYALALIEAYHDQKGKENNQFTRVLREADAKAKAAAPIAPPPPASSPRAASSSMQLGNPTPILHELERNSWKVNGVDLLKLAASECRSKGLQPTAEAAVKGVLAEILLDKVKGFGDLTMKDGPLIVSFYYSKLMAAGLLPSA